MLSSSARRSSLVDERRGQQRIEHELLQDASAEPERLDHRLGLGQRRQPRAAALDLAARARDSRARARRRPRASARARRRRARARRARYTSALPEAARARAARCARHRLPRADSRAARTGRARAARSRTAAARAPPGRCARGGAARCRACTAIQRPFQGRVRRSSSRQPATTDWTGAAAAPSRYWPRSSLSTRPSAWRRCSATRRLPSAIPNSAPAWTSAATGMLPRRSVESRSTIRLRGVGWSHPVILHRVVRVEQIL